MMLPLGQILIADDKLENLRVLGAMLREQRHPFIVATNGTEAIARAQSHQPELILLDINMPDLDGYEVCARLKADPATADIPVIFVSGLSATWDKVRGFEVGAVDYILKPYSPEEVEARIKTQLHLGRLKRSLQRHNEELEALVSEKSDELHQAYLDLADQDRFKSDFLNAMAHEMRTPLNGLLGMWDLAATGLSTTAELAEDFHDARVRIMALLDDAAILSDLSNPESDYGAGAAATVPLGTAWELAIAAYRGDTGESRRPFQLPLREGVLLRGEARILAQGLAKLLRTIEALQCEDDSAVAAVALSPGWVELTWSVRAGGFSDRDLPTIFQVRSVARQSSILEKLALAPVIGNRVIRSFGGEVELLRKPGEETLSLRLKLARAGS